MHEDDLPGYLIDAINTAVATGLTQLLLCRVGTSKTMWQASSRMAGADAHRVAIEEDPYTAIFGVLGPRRVPCGAPAVAATDLDIFD